MIGPAWAARENEISKRGVVANAGSGGEGENERRAAEYGGVHAIARTRGAVYTTSAVILMLREAKA